MKKILKRKKKAKPVIVQLEEATLSTFERI